ncbi:hypothetical protein [Paenibacillus sp. MMS20-IR301]|nr:hypothetical protein [Paenibacillus sp. MMS20-IR301]WNS44108.1 hypothetical protein LOS79_02250 [Paenibacillus sp. MMS20-IR301]
MTKAKYTRLNTKDYIMIRICVSGAASGLPDKHAGKAGVIR